MKKLVFTLTALLVFGLCSCVPDGKEKVGLTEGGFCDFYLDTIKTKNNHEIIFVIGERGSIVGCYESMSCPACVGLRGTTETDATEY